MLCTYSAGRGPVSCGIGSSKLATAAGCPGDLSRVRIGTIHGLCGRILRSHAKRAGLRSDLARCSTKTSSGACLLRRYDEVFGPDRHLLEREGWRWKEPRPGDALTGANTSNGCATSSSTPRS